jgi:hypothetical protein
LKTIVSSVVVTFALTGPPLELLDVFPLLEALSSSSSAGVGVVSAGGSLLHETALAGSTIAKDRSKVVQRRIVP